MEALTEILKSFPRARQTLTKSGDSEIDATCQPSLVWVSGPVDHACFECDMIARDAEKQGLFTSRIGPRELHVSKTVQIVNYTLESASF